jgi:hypothetical protein
MVLTLLVLPAAYTMWRRHQVRATLGVFISQDGAAPTERAAGAAWLEQIASKWPFA